MTEHEAVELLRFHSYTHPDLDDPRATNGFIGMLRPFKGTLHEAAFHEIMELLKTLKYYLNKPAVDREIISNFWAICHLSSAWAMEEGGMLRRNNLITDAQITLLSTWINCISYAVMNLLEGVPEEEAFELYTAYRKEKQ